MDVESGFDGGFNSQLHLAVLGYRPQQSIRQLSQEAFTAINQEGVTARRLMNLSFYRLL